MTTEGQRISRRFGDVAIEQGLVTPEVIQKMLERQNEIRDQRGKAPPLGRMLVAYGYMSPRDRDRILSSNDAMFGRVFDSYKVEAFIARGSMGSVFRARDLEDNKRVALKVLYKNLLMDRVNLDMFVQECRTSCLLKHENLVAGYSYGQAHGRPYYAMELVEGESMDTIIRREKKIPEAMILEIARQVASGLSAAHDYNILHRDVKPSNIFFDGKLAKLGDLGLSLSLLDHRQKARDEGYVVGTPHYTSPEQAEGLIDVTPAADIYCLGATVYHAVCGQPPFPDDDVETALDGHLYGTAPSPWDFQKNLSRPFMVLLAWMMARKADHRIGSARQLVEEIERVQRGEYPSCGQRVPRDCTFDTKGIVTRESVFRRATRKLGRIITQSGRLAASSSAAAETAPPPDDESNSDDSHSGTTTD